MTKFIHSGDCVSSLIISSTSKLIFCLFNHPSGLTLQPHGLQHTRSPCPLPSPEACPSSCPSSHLILWCLLLLPSIFPSIRVFSSEWTLYIRWPKYWSFSFSISPSNEYSGLIAFRIDWFDLPAVQGTLKSLFQHHSLKASLLVSCRPWSRKE